MSLVPNQSGKSVFEYSPDDTYAALTLALSGSNEFSIKTQNPVTRAITATKRMSLTSGLQNIFANVFPTADGISEVSITSSFMFGLFDFFGENNSNITTILNLLSDELQKYKKVSSKTEAISQDIPTQIKRLAELKDEGILTEANFSRKKSNSF